LEKDYGVPEGGLQPRCVKLQIESNKGTFFAPTPAHVLIAIITDSNSYWMQVGPFLSAGCYR